MKILHVIVGLDVGGAELMLKRLIASHNADPSYSHTVVALGEDGPVGWQLREMGVEVESLGLNSARRSVGVLVQLVKLIRKRRPDIVQTWMYHADLIGGVAARLASCRKVIWGIRNTDLFSSRGVSPATGWIMRVCAALSRVVPHTIVCVGSRARATHVEAGYAVEKMIVISNGFDIERFKRMPRIRHEVRASLEVPADALLIGSVGRFNEYKDHRNFVDAAAIVAAASSKAYFLMIGRDIDSKNVELNRWIEETNHANRFRLVGQRTDLPSMFASMDVFCLHSKSEGFPNALGEAMCTELPSVVTDVGDARSMLGDAGLVVLPHRADELAEALLTMLQLSPEDRNSLGKKARKRIKDHYSMNTVKRRFEDLYQKVVCE